MQDSTEEVGKSSVLGSDGCTTGIGLLVNTIPWDSLTYYFYYHYDPISSLHRLLVELAPEIYADLTCYSL